MIVCLCHRISDRDIALEVGNGCASFDELQEELRVATGCGSCVECANEVFAACRRQVAATAAPSSGAAQERRLFALRRAPRHAALPGQTGTAANECR